MIKKSSIILMFLFICCQKPTLSFDEKVVNFALSNPSDTFVEISNYDTLTTVIPYDKEEQLRLVEVLKKKGFKVEHVGRGNHSLGPRVVVVTMRDKNCECEVQKLYYNTISDSTYECREKIKCKPY